MKYGLVVGLCIVACGAWQVVALPQEAEQQGEVAAELSGPGSLTVMTRSLGLEAGLRRVLETPRAAELPQRTAETFTELSRSSLEARARALADELQYARPHLLGLQDVWQVRTQRHGDALFGGTQPAEELVVDFLPLLLGELESRGLRYREVGRVRNLDVELPMRQGGAQGFEDARFTGFDVVLARTDVEVANTWSRRYRASRTVKVPGLGEVVRQQGWVSLVATVEQRTYRFVSTHLEPSPDEPGQQVQLAQARELMASLRGEPLPVVLVGDFNTPAHLGLMGAPTYRELLLAGYVDVWSRQLAAPDWKRLHLILVRQGEASRPRQLGPVMAWPVGESPMQGLQAEKRNGLVARLRLPVALRP
jgi:hypothetical protein